MKLEKFEADARRRPFFLEISIILEEKVQNLAMIPSDDLFFGQHHGLRTNNRSMS